MGAEPAVTWHPVADQQYLLQQQPLPHQQQVVPHSSDSQLGGGGYQAQAAPSAYYHPATGPWATY